jgi:hypothetical protein
VFGSKLTWKSNAFLSRSMIIRLDQCNLLLVFFIAQTVGWENLDPIHEMVITLE